MTIKAEAINAISNLPDNAEIEDIMYRLYVIQKIKEGQKAVIDGKTKRIEDLKKEVSHW